MLTWFLNPWMLLGGLAIASPILIHLLNKRRFKIVEWAAMDFLFEADKKNRRRVQMENFILLLLRCLAMLLLALMLARPFLPSSMTAILQQSQKVERVILLDDSLSQRVLNESQTSLDVGKESLKKLITDLANSNDTEDWLTLMLTSDQSQFLIDNQPLTVNTLSGHLQTIDDITFADSVADYNDALSRMKEHLSGDQNYGRAAYIYTDLRKRDWMPVAGVTGADDAQVPNKILQSFASEIEGTYVIDTAGPNDQNLAITSIRADGLLVANKVINFIVEVANFGNTTLTDLRVLLQIGENQPEYKTLASIGPNERQEILFTSVFAPTSSDNDLLAVQEERTQSKDWRIRAEIDRQSLVGDASQLDQLPEDSARLLAASVIDGIPVLLVDGDPSSTSERSETHYLRSLEVLGTGLKMTTATVSDLETASLSDYSVIFLCNVDEVSSDRTAALGQWVSAGGSLVLMPGNRVRAATFNNTFYAEGEGLSPLKLSDITGDPTMATWTNFEVDPQIHPALQVMIDSDASSLGKVDVFSWWTSEMGADQDLSSTSIPLRLTDADNSIAMLDRRLEDGRVIVFTIPGDGDWTMWPSSPTFAPVMVDLISYLAGSAVAETSVQLGSNVKIPVDLTAFENRVSLRDPENEKMETVARPLNPDKPDSVLYEAEFDDLSKRGFYDIQLKRHTGEIQSTLVATNYDPRESQLKRLSASALDTSFFGDNVSLVTSKSLTNETVDAGNSELWMMILVGLMGILGIEQFLGWFWGRKR